MISELLLNFDYTPSCKSFTIKDASIYNTVLPVTCGQLTVKTPGFTCEHTFEVLPEFEIKINLGNLGIQNVNDPTCLKVLPEGNYEIKYSINPNDKLYVEYNYYNTCQLHNEYIKAICKFLNNKCDMTKKEQQLEIDRLFEISNLIDYAKVAAEECGDIKMADKLYNEAKDKLKIHGCSTC